MKRKFVGLFLVLAMVVGCLPNVVWAININDDEVFLKQQTSYTCTLASAAMMLRRRAILNGNSNWASITESSMRSTAWIEEQGLRGSFSYAGMNVTQISLSGDKKSQLISVLNAHPEGVEVYNKSHAVLITDYTNGTFYCGDPSYASYIPKSRIPLTSSYLKGGTQDGIINNLTSYWYITNYSGGGDTTPPTLGSPIDLGAEFFAYIINNKTWMPISVTNDEELVLEKETGQQNQMWKFTRLDDGSYKIISLKDGKALDVCNYGAEPGTRVGTWGYSGNTAQQWYIYGEGNYKLKAKCTDCVLDVGGGKLIEGAPLQTYTYNNTDAQKFQIYKVSDTFALGKPINLGSEFYAKIINTKTKLPITMSTNLILSKETEQINQIWKFVKLDNGSYAIISLKDGKALDVYNYETSPNTKVGTFEYSGNTAQQWYIYGRDKNYKLKAKCTDCVLDVGGGKLIEGAPLQTYTYNDTDAQKFQILIVDAPSTPTPVNKIFTVSQNYGNAVIKNNTNQAHNATIILAKYNGDIYENSTIIQTTLAANEQRTVHTDYSSDYKVFVWDSLESMKPLAK